jgi:pimeloyl-ACP methyl ester carboxylesterase
LSSSRNRGRAAAGVALVGILATTSLVSCGDDEGDKGKLKANCSKIRCEGERPSGKYKLQLPQTWNGTLLIYNHGYRQADVVPPNNEPVNTAPANAPSDDVATELLGKGYALLGSSYKSNGWAVRDGVEADEDLYQWFTKEVGTPIRTYVWGHSLGGLITQTFAEKHPEWVDGVIPMCGVLAGTNMNLDLALDVTYAIKMLGIYPALKLTDYTDLGEAVDNFEAAYDAVLAATKDITNGVPKLLAINALVDASKKTRKYDGSDLVSSVSAGVESLVTALGYGTYGRYEIEQRVQGNPSTNVDADYSNRIDDGEASLIESLAPGSVAKFEQQLQDGVRVEADETARRSADELGNPTGELKDPTITIHTAHDPLVIVQNERVFAERVNAAKDREEDLLQLYTLPPATYDEAAGAPYGAGHCNFSKTEHLALIQLLDDWVQRSGYPGPAAVSKAFGTSDNGLALSYLPPGWPTEH